MLQEAVSDRLRSDRVGILLSGGLDSSSVAATARELSTVAGGAAELRAYTVVYENLIADRDGANAQLVADFLRIPIRRLAVDDLPLFDRWDDAELAWPEPVDDPLAAGVFDQFQMIATDCRVVLSGEGSDNLMYFEMWPYVTGSGEAQGMGAIARRSAVAICACGGRRGPAFAGVSRIFFAKIRKRLRSRQWIAPDFPEEN